MVELLVMCAAALTRSMLSKRKKCNNASLIACPAHDRMFRILFVVCSIIGFVTAELIISYVP